MRKKYILINFAAVLSLIGCQAIEPNNVPKQKPRSPNSLIICPLPGLVLGSQPFYDLVTESNPETIIRHKLSYGGVEIISQYADKELYQRAMDFIKKNPDIHIVDAVRLGVPLKKSGQ